MTTAVANLLEGANENQKKAIMHIEGPCYVTAGPGSGKTFTVVRRTANMILEGIPANNICLFTFTNKAANEIKERVIDYIGDEAKQIVVGTYHSVCCRYLRKYAKAIGFTRSFSILDSDESVKILKKHAKAYEIDYKDAQNFIADCKKKLIGVNMALVNAKNDYQRRCANVYQMYEDELKRTNAMDFDNLIINMIKLLEQNPEIKQTINNQLKYIMADESHDSSVVDLRLITLLSGESENICMIMDPDQSIYSFRGANIESVMKHRYAFNKKVSIFNLAENYRCSQTIVNASKSLIAKNEVLLKEKTVVPARDYKGAPIVIKECTFPKDEAIAVANLISLLRKRGLEYKDIAILYRTGMASKDIEQVLISKNIPYNIIGGLPFMSRREIKDILSYVRIIVNPYDVVAFKRAISVPKRGLGEATVEKIEEFSLDTTNGEPKSIRQAAKEISIKRSAKSLKQFNELLDELEADKLNLSPDKFLTKVIQKIGYIDFVLDTDEDSDERISNIEKLVDIASTYENIEDLLESTALNPAASDDEELPNCVQLMTLHASKGLEFKGVIIAGCVEGSLPHFKSAGSVKAIEEERRLFYVGMTRAKDYLFLTTTKKQLVNRAYVNAVESRFLTEIEGFTHRV